MTAPQANRTVDILRATQSPTSFDNLAQHFHCLTFQSRANLRHNVAVLIRFGLLKTCQQDRVVRTPAGTEQLSQSDAEAIASFQAVFGGVDQC